MGIYKGLFHIILFSTGVFYNYLKKKIEKEKFPCLINP